MSRTHSYGFSPVYEEISLILLAISEPLQASAVSSRFVFFFSFSFLEIKFRFIGILCIRLCRLPVDVLQVMPLSLVAPLLFKKKEKKKRTVAPCSITQQVAKNPIFVVK